MSWDSYVDSLIANSGGVITKGTIIGLNGALWTPGTAEKIINISQPEAMSIAAVMAQKNAAVEDNFAANGITIGGTRYMFLRDVYKDGRMMTGKKAGVGNIIMMSSVQAIVIGFIPEDKGDAARGATTPVEKIVQHLEQSGY